MVNRAQLDRSHQAGEVVRLQASPALRHMEHNLGFVDLIGACAAFVAPASSDFGAHPKRCMGGFEQFLQAIDPDAVGDAHAVRAVWADAVAAPEWEGVPMWLHGDLHPVNVVVSDGTLSGVIDFGALFAGDPAWDLGAAWVLLPAGTAARFFDADAATIRRARGLAAMKSLFLMLMGQNGDRGLSGGKPNWDLHAGRHLIVFWRAFDAHFLNLFSILVDSHAAAHPRGFIDHRAWLGCQGPRQYAARGLDRAG